MSRRAKRASTRFFHAHPWVLAPITLLGLAAIGWVVSRFPGIALVSGVIALLLAAHISRAWRK